MSVISVIQPKTPLSKNWQRRALPPEVILGYPYQAYCHKTRKLLVISAVEAVRENPGSEKTCYFHISISKKNHKRCSPEEAWFVLEEFGIEDAEKTIICPAVLSGTSGSP